MNALTNITTTNLDQVAPTIVCYENHAQDSRVKEHGNLSPTCHAQMGTGGNNVPLILWKHSSKQAEPGARMATVNAGHR